jgi:hypothetical protein
MRSLIDYNKNGKLMLYLPGQQAWRRWKLEAHTFRGKDPRVLYEDE